MRTSIFLLFLFPLIAISQSVSGLVFNDSNQNGIRDEGEAGIAKVAVSNGREVVKTDRKGRYSLNIDNDDIIFVIKPQGYRTAVDSMNLPQFFYRHKPNGSPEMRFAGVAPTGELPESVDFGLIPQEESEAFNILYFGDPQPYNEQEVNFFARSIVREVANTKEYPFGISLGDLVGDDLSLFQPYNEAIAQIGVPWYNVYGNHDMNLDAPTDSLADETFERVFGPANYAFNYGKVHFIILDDVVYPRSDGEPGYIGGFTEEQLTFVANDLKQVPTDHLVVIHFHIPLSLEAFFGKTFRKADRNRFFALFKKYPRTLSLSAHTHMQEQFFYGKEDGWLNENPHHHFNVGTTCGDWWCGEPDAEGIPDATMRDGTPKGYLIMSFDGNQYSYEYKAYGKSIDYKMRLYAPYAVRQGNRTSGELIVNFFQGTPKDSLFYRIDGGEWRSMWRMEVNDPFVNEIQGKWDRTLTPPEGRRPSNPVNSPHLWKTRLRTDLPTGLHTIEVKAKDFLGREYSDQTVYRIVK